jgi:hypothetical protein
MAAKSLDIDINHANTHDLERVLRDRDRAQLIVNKREVMGDFKSWEELQETVPGLTDDKVRALRAKGVTVGPRALARAPRSRPAARRRPGSRIHARG